MEISDIAKKIAMSSKTVARTLEKMIKNHVLDFTIQINFTTIGGYIASVVSATVEKGFHTKVLERSYLDLEDSFFVYSPMLSQQDLIYWLFFSKDVFALELYTRY
jgi:DNA-binding Lrp family transcriptional regulator